MISSYVRKTPFKFRAYLVALILASLSITSQAATLSGVITDKAGTPIEGAWAALFEATGPTTNDLSAAGAAIKVSGTGEYSWDVDDGQYVVRAYFNSSDVSLTGAPNSVSMYSQDYTVAGETPVIRDSVFEFFLLSGQVIDSNNLPISNVDLVTATLSWSGPEVGAIGQLSRYSIAHNNSTSTDVNGQYSILLFPTDSCTNVDCAYNITFEPTVSSGFSTEIESNYTITSDQVLNAELSITDQTNPVVIIGPYVKNITDISAVIEWITDEVTDASVDIVGGGSFTSPSLSTFHSVAITGLVADNSYTAQINSSDAQGNSVSVTDTINSASTPDITTPLFIQAPSVSAIGYDQFTIAFCANEPVSGKIIVGISEYPLAGLSVCHELLIDDGLSSNTKYTVKASITDIAVNGPTESLAIDVTTLSAADFSSPIITASPIIIDISDKSAIVRWTTNEPATSGVSYNNGEIYQVTNNENLSTEHNSQITGLSADTTYWLSVSSKDFAGNGPTTSDIIEFTTQATADSNAPEFIGRPLVQDITDNQAVISWLTDESSSTLLRFGTDQSNLDRVETSIEFTPEHQVILTNLDASATYYFTIESVDLSGNLATFSSDFTTREQNTVPNRLKITTGPIIERLTGNLVTLSWKTNLLSDSRLVCESSHGITEVNKIYATKTHVLSLTDLAPNTRYRCATYSTDSEGGERKDNTQHKGC